MMCEFHESTCNGFRDIWWTDKRIYFSSTDRQWPLLILACLTTPTSYMTCHQEEGAECQLYEPSMQ